MEVIYPVQRSGLKGVHLAARLTLANDLHGYLVADEEHLAGLGYGHVHAGDGDAVPAHSLGALIIGHK